MTAALVACPCVIVLGAGASGAGADDTGGDAETAHGELADGDDDPDLSES
mgnify:CR=1 FL=1